MQRPLTDCLLVEVALLLIGLTENSLTKSSFDHPSVIESSLRLWAQEERRGCILSMRMQPENNDLTRGTTELVQHFR
jgi:hypothetical protein